MPYKPRRLALVFIPMALATLVGVSEPASAAPVTVEPAASVIKHMSGTERGNATVPYPFDVPAGKPMLSRFWFGFSRGDHHVRSLEVDAEETNLQVRFADVNHDDEYNYQVSHRWAAVTPISAVHAGQATTPLSGCADGCFLNLSRAQPSGSPVLVIRGFYLEWRALDDRHIDTVEILQDGAKIWVAFSDDSNNDHFKAVVDYYWAPSNFFSEVTEISGGVANVGRVRDLVSAGPKVIRGFSFRAVDDNHLGEIGVQTNSGSIDLFYGDNDPSNSGSWDYRVQYATLR